MAEPMKILVADDEEAVRMLLQRILEAGGFEVITAADGNEALAKISQGNIGVVLLDIKMPGLSGIDVLGKLSADRPDICVIMVTAIADVQTAVDAMKMGAYDYITKPFNQDDVLGKVRHAIDRWASQIQEMQDYLQLKESISEQTRQMQEQFNELVSSLAREHRLLLQLAAKQGKNGESMLSELPPELREPISSVEEFRDALLRILKRS